MVTGIAPWSSFPTKQYTGQIVKRGLQLAHKKMLNVHRPFSQSNTA